MSEAPELIHAKEPQADPQRRAASADEKAQMHMLCSVMQQTFAPWRQHMMEEGASPNSDTLLATAVATFAGTILGELVGMGIMGQLAVPGALETMRKNMEAGVEIGKKHVARVAEKVLAEDQQGGKQ